MVIDIKSNRLISDEQFELVFSDESNSRTWLLLVGTVTEDNKTVFSSPITSQLDYFTLYSLEELTAHREVIKEAIHKELDKRNPAKADSYLIFHEEKSKDYLPVSEVLFEDKETFEKTHRIMQALNKKGINHQYSKGFVLAFQDLLKSQGLSIQKIKEV